MRRKAARKRKRARTNVGQHLKNKLTPGLITRSPWKNTVIAPTTLKDPDIPRRTESATSNEATMCTEAMEERPEWLKPHERGGKLKGSPFRIAWSSFSASDGLRNCSTKVICSALELESTRFRDLLLAAVCRAQDRGFLKSGRHGLPQNH